MKNKLVKLTSKESFIWEASNKSTEAWKDIQIEFPRLQKYEGVKETNTLLDTHKVDTLKLTKVITPDLKESWEIHLNGDLIGKGYTDLPDALNDYEGFKENVMTGKVGRVKLKQDEICTLVKK